MSLPSRERELKLACIALTLVFAQSLPSRERELKPYRVYVLGREEEVAPFTGA